MSVVDDILAHHGVKGMHWGVNRSGHVTSTTTKTSKLKRPATDVVATQKPGRFVKTKGGAKQIADADAVKSSAARQIAKKSTTDALSNKQLQDAVTRMNLEQQFATLSKKSDRRDRGKKLVDSLLKSPKGKEVSDGIVKQVGTTLAKKAASGG